MRHIAYVLIAVLLCINEAHADCFPFVYNSYENDDGCNSPAKRVYWFLQWPDGAGTTDFYSLLEEGLVKVPRFAVLRIRRL